MKVVECQYCDRRVFLADLPKIRNRVTFEVEPWRCGYMIERDPPGEVALMGREYFRIGETPGDGSPVFRQHTCAAGRLAAAQRALDRERGVEGASAAWDEERQAWRGTSVSYAPMPD